MSVESIGNRTYAILEVMSGSVGSFLVAEIRFGFSSLVTDDERCGNSMKSIVLKLVLILTWGITPLTADETIVVCRLVLSAMIVGGCLLWVWQPVMHP